MSRIRSDGNGNLIAPKWIAVAVPVVTAVAGALVGALTMLLVAVTETELDAAFQHRDRVIGERWSGHGIAHNELRERLVRMEAKQDRSDDKLDRLLERRP